MTSLVALIASCKGREAPMPIVAVWRQLASGWLVGGLPVWLVPGLASNGGASSVAFDIHLEDGGVVDEAVDGGDGHCRITEHLGMPQRLTGESLRCGWLIHTIPFMASAFRSAVDARDGDRG